MCHLSSVQPWADQYVWLFLSIMCVTWLMAPSVFCTYMQNYRAWIISVQQPLSALCCALKLSIPSVYQHAMKYLLPLPITHLCEAALSFMSDTKKKDFRAEWMNRSSFHSNCSTHWQMSYVETCWSELLSKCWVQFLLFLFRQWMEYVYLTFF